MIFLQYSSCCCCEEEWGMLSSVHSSWQVPVAATAKIITPIRSIKQTICVDRPSSVVVDWSEGNSCNVAHDIFIINTLIIIIIIINHTSNWWGKMPGHLDLTSSDLTGLCLWCPGSPVQSQTIRWYFGWLSCLGRPGPGNTERGGWRELGDVWCSPVSTCELEYWHYWYNKSQDGGWHLRETFSILF